MIRGWRSMRSTSLRVCTRRGGMAPITREVRKIQELFRERGVSGARPICCRLIAVARGDAIIFEARELLREKIVRTARLAMALDTIRFSCILLSAARLPNSVANRRRPSSHRGRRSAHRGNSSWRRRGPNRHRIADPGPSGLRLYPPYKNSSAFWNRPAHAPSDVSRLLR